MTTSFKPPEILRRFVKDVKQTKRNKVLVKDNVSISEPYTLALITTKQSSSMTLQMAGKRETAEQNIIIIFHSRSHQSLARRDHLVLESEIGKAYTSWLYAPLRFYVFFTPCLTRVRHSYVALDCSSVQQITAPSAECWRSDGDVTTQIKDGWVFLHLHFWIANLI